MQKSQILRNPGSGEKVNEIIGKFNKIRWTSIFGKGKGIGEGLIVPIVPPQTQQILVKKENKKQIIKKKEKSWLEQKATNLHISFWNKVLFQSVVIIGRGVSFFIPGLGGVIKALETAGPALTAVAAKLLICTGTRSIGWITGSIPWETASKGPLMLENNPVIISENNSAIIPEIISENNNESFKEELAKIVIETFSPELTGHIEEELKNSAEGIGIPRTMVEGGIRLASIGAAVKGISNLNVLDKIDLEKLELGQYTELTIVVLAFLALGISIYWTYNYFKSLTQNNYKISENLKEEILQEIEPENKETVETLIKMINKEKI